MSPPRRLYAPGALVRRRLAQSGEERGTVIVMVAVWLPIAVLIAAFVVDIANWFVHRRHLQMQADAAASRGGGRLSYREIAIPAALEGARLAVRRVLL